MRFLAGLIVACAALTSAAAQQEPATLRLQGLMPSGARSTITEGWGTLQFTIENFGDAPRDARVIAFYTERRDVQYGRDVWVPGRSQVTSWLPIGPAPEFSSELRRDIKFMLFDHTGGGLRPLSSTVPEEMPSRPLIYRKREPTTALVVDGAAGSRGDEDPFAAPRSPQSQSLLLARTFRHARGLSEYVSIIFDRDLPPFPEVLDGIDHLILAGNRLAADPAGRRAIRHWVLQGGTLWVLLDRVDADVIAPILGESQRFQVVDRTSLTTVRLRGRLDDPSSVQPRQFDEPVEFARVMLSGSEMMLFDVEGWPAAFSQPLGRGRVIVTTLGGRAWYRERTAKDPAPRFERYPDVPVSLWALDTLAWQIQGEPEDSAFRIEELAPILTAEIGYEVIGRRTAAAILIGFVLAVLLAGVWLRRTRSPELFGLAAPALAVLAASVFIVLGVASRRSVPSTAAAASVVEFAPETGEAAARGLFAVYNPESGTTELGTEHGGEVVLDQSGLEGQTRRRIQTDIDAWHWENLAYPAGVRMGPFRSTIRARGSAIGRFGPGGLEGRLIVEPFRGLADPVVLTRSGMLLAPRFDSSGAFAVSADSGLPPGQYLPGAVLSDRQQRRQGVYRKLLARPRASHLEGHDLLLVWSDGDDLPFDSGNPARRIGTSLLVLPLEIERSAPDSAVTIPAGFCSFNAVIEGRSSRPTFEGVVSVRNRLRFQLPPGILPFELERAALVARVNAPGRKLTVSGVEEGRAIPLHETMSPRGSVRVDMTDPRALRLDPAGGLLLDVAVSGLIGPDGREISTRTSEPDVKWQIEEVGLELRGRIRGQ